MQLLSTAASKQLLGGMGEDESTMKGLSERAVLLADAASVELQALPYEVCTVPALAVR